jgi:signal transduction histidine kinase
MSTRDPVNILMVDDQPAKLLTYELILSELKENLIRAGSAKEALEHLLRTDIAVVLMDVSMPDIDGFELAAMIRQHPRYQKTAIILVSAIHLTDLDRLKGYEVGAVDYVPVPVVPEILRAKVSVFADLYRKTQQLTRLNAELERRVSERTADLQASTERLEEADRRKDRFLATLAHELRNPLAPIASATKIIGMKATADPNVQWARQAIERQLAHLTRLVDDLLDVNRISQNKLELRKEKTDLNAIVNAASESSRPLIEQFGHKLTVNLPENPVYLQADVVRLSQVFTNLLNNSAKFTNRGGRIELTAEVVANDVVLRVKDNGIGIAPEHIPHISELFYQNDSSLEKAQGGLGVGLTLVWQLVEMHGGSVEARSDGIGRGSEFIVRLPRWMDAPAGEREIPIHDNASPSGMRVLIADDNQDSADGLVLMLQLEGFIAEGAYDGEEALKKAEEFRPDAVLLDIGMPKLNGYEVAAQIRQQPWGKNLLLVAQTGWGQEEDMRRSQEAGFNFHLTKPLDFDKLKSVLATSKAARL